MYLFSTATIVCDTIGSPVEDPLPHALTQRNFYAQDTLIEQSDKYSNRTVTVCNTSESFTEYENLHLQHQPIGTLSGLLGILCKLNSLCISFSMMIYFWLMELMTVTDIYMYRSLRKYDLDICA